MYACNEYLSLDSDQNSSIHALRKTFETGWTESRRY